MFKLSNQLGGRNEVIKAPAIELLQYMDMTLEREKKNAEKEQLEWWIDYLSRTFSQQPMGNPDSQYIQAKRDFERMLMPTPKAPTRVYEWDFSLLEQHKERR